MSGLMFPKMQTKKKRKKHSPSILQSYDNRCCFLCSLEGNYQEYEVLQEHHIFGGPNRDLSEAYGLKVRLCLLHHMFSDVSAHGNRETADQLHQLGQEAFEQTHTREEFMKLFGRNYL